MTLTRKTFKHRVCLSRLTLSKIGRAAERPSSSLRCQPIAGNDLLYRAPDRQIQSHHQNRRGGNYEQGLLQPPRIIAGDGADDARADGQADPPAGNDEAHGGAGHARKRRADDGQGGGKDRCHGKTGGEDQGKSGDWLAGPQHEECSYSHRGGCGQGHVNRGNARENRRHADAPRQQAERESQRKNVERARFRNALRDKVARQPIPHANFAGDVEEEKESKQKQQRPAKDRSRVGKDKARCARGRGHAGDGLNGQRDDGERGDGIAEADPVLFEEIGGDEGRGESAQAKEEVDEVQRGGAMRLAYATGQRIGASHHDAAADSEQKHENQNSAETLRARQDVERDGDEDQAEKQANLVAFAIQQRTHADRGNDQPQRLHKGDGSVLRGSEVKAIRQVGQDGAQHGANHSVDEDGDDGGEDQHAAAFLASAGSVKAKEHRSSRAFAGSQARL